jgi:O-antigen ligase
MIKYIQEKKIKKILEYLIYFVAFLLTLQTRYFLRLGEINGSLSEYATISLYGVDLLIIIVILLNCYIAFKDFRFKILDFRFKFVWYLIAGLELFIFISIFFADDKILALYRYGVFMLGVALFWVLTTANFDKIRLLYFFIGGMFLQAVLGTWQFLTQSSLANKWLGLAMHNPRELGVSVIEAVGPDGVGERWLRAYGGMEHPNILGGILAVGLLILLGLYLKLIPKLSSYAKASAARQILNKLQTQNFASLLFYFLLFTSLLFSFSRGAWLGFVVGMIVLLAGLVIKKDLFKQRELLIIILISAVLFSLVYSQYANLFQTRMSLSSRLENISYAERVSSINDAEKIVKDNILFGTGIGNYPLELSKNINNRLGWFYQPVHNTFLLVLSEIGIFGFLFWLVLIFYLLFKFFKDKDYLALGVLASLIVIMQFDHWLWSLHFGVLFWWFVLGTLLTRKDNLV